MFYPAPTDGRYSNGLRCLILLYVFNFKVYVFYILVTLVSVLLRPTTSLAAMAHFICTNVYWRDNVHADVIVLWLMCHVGSLCVNKILTYLVNTRFKFCDSVDGLTAVLQRIMPNRLTDWLIDWLVGWLVDWIWFNVTITFYNIHLKFEIGLSRICHNIKRYGQQHLTYLK